MQTDADESITWGELNAMFRSTPGGKNLVARMKADSFDEFVRVLHLDLDEIIKTIESNPQRHADDDEDGLTYFIATMLKQRQYRANQGVTRGGNVDLTVEGREEDFVWTSEAKIYRSLSAVREGFLQLHTRYSPADLLHDKAGLLIYIKRPGAADLMSDWQLELDNMKLQELETSDCPIRPRLAFTSMHKSHRSGLTAMTRHMSVSVFQDPQDKSGLSAQKHIARRDQKAA